MKTSRKQASRILALLLSFMLFFGQSGISAFAEGESSPTDLQPAATETVVPSEPGESENASGSPEDPAGDNEEKTKEDKGAGDDVNAK